MDPKPVITALPSATTDVTQRSRDDCHARLRDMLRIRRMEERCAELYGAGKIRGFLHLYIGEEAVAAGVMPHLRAEDNVVATYREHGHALLRGVSMNAIMAEMYGKREGCSRGRGGSMHLFDAATRFYGGNAIVGGGLPLAVRPGARRPAARARDARHRLLLRRGRGGRGRVPRVAEPRGAVAAARALPLREQPLRDGHRPGALGVGDRPRAQRPRPTASRPSTVNGMDVLAVDDGRRGARSSTCGGTRTPFFLELPHLPVPCALDVRFRALSREGRGRGVEGARADPHVHAAAEGGRHADRGRVPALDAAVVGEVDDAVAFAEAGQWEPVEDLLRDVSTPRAERRTRSDRRDATTYRDALREAHREALQRDPRVFLMGEDVGRYGGCYAVTQGPAGRVRRRAHARHAAVGARLSSAPASARRWAACGRSSRS